MKFENPFKKDASKTENKSSTGISRRDFLKYGSITAVSLGVGGVVGNIAGEEAAEVMKGKTLEDYKLDLEELVNQSELTERVLELQEKISERYGIDVFVDQEGLDTTSVNHSHSDTELRLTKQIEGLEILSEELERYPDFMIKQYGLRVMAISTSARNENKNIGGYLMPGNIDSLNALELPEIILHYDWNAPYQIPEDKRYDFGETEYSKEEQAEIWQDAVKRTFRSTIHHELSHFMIDEAGSEVTPRLEEFSFVQKWDQEFGPVNEKLRDLLTKTDPAVTKNGEAEPDFSRINSTVSGMARGYSLKNEEEDRATMAEDLMLHGPDQRINSDVLLKDKTELVKEYYLDASCGLMNDWYWETLAPIGSGFQMQHHFSETAIQIVETPYEDSEYKEVVTKAKYEQWQNKLKHTDLAKGVKTESR